MGLLLLSLHYCHISKGRNKKKKQKQTRNLELHPHICNLFDNDVTHDGYIFVMPFQAADTSFLTVIMSETSDVRTPFLSGTIFYYCNARRSSLSLYTLGYTSHLNHVIKVKMDQLHASGNFTRSM